MHAQFTNTDVAKEERRLVTVYVIPSNKGNQDRPFFEIESVKPLFDGTSELHMLNLDVIRRGEVETHYNNHHFLAELWTGDSPVVILGRLTVVD